MFRRTLTFKGQDSGWPGDWDSWQSGGASKRHGPLPSLPSKALPGRPHPRQAKEEALLHPRNLHPTQSTLSPLPPFTARGCSTHILRKEGWSQARWLMPGIPALREAKAGGSIEPSSRPQ